MLALFYGRRRMLLIIAAVMAATIAIAVQIERKYEAKSSLLVLFGPEYSFRPAAGQQSGAGNSVEDEQVLQTEAEILGNDELYRSVISDFGIERLYPQLLKPPSGFSKFMADAKQYLQGLAGNSAPGAAADPSADLLATATRVFAANLAIGVDRKSAVIRVSFKHPNPTTAAEVLRSLEAHYFALRGKLFDDLQASIVEAQENGVADQLGAADRVLAIFKREHDIANFAERQKILLTQQGRLEDELKKTDSTVTGLQARVAELSQQLKVASGQKGNNAAPNAAAAMQSAVEAFRRRENDAATTYRGSSAVDTARMEVLKSQAELATMQTSNAFITEQEFNKSQADLKTNTAARDTIKTQLASINAELASIGADETRLHQLERARSVLEDQYRSVGEILDERRVVDAVNSHRRASVRVIDAPIAPTTALGTRRLVLMAGTLVACILGLLSVLLPNLLWGGYVRLEALELDTGLTVLASLPESEALARPALLVTAGGDCHNTVVINSMAMRDPAAIYVVSPGGRHATGGYLRMVDNLMTEWEQRERQPSLVLVDSYGNKGKGTCRPTSPRHSGASFTTDCAAGSGCCTFIWRNAAASCGRACWSGWHACWGCLPSCMSTDAAPRNCG